MDIIEMNCSFARFVYQLFNFVEVSGDDYQFAQQSFLIKLVNTLADLSSFSGMHASCSDYKIFFTEIKHFSCMKPFITVWPFDHDLSLYVSHNMNVFTPDSKCGKSICILFILGKKNIEILKKEFKNFSEFKVSVIRAFFHSGIYYSYRYRLFPAHP